MFRRRDRRPLWEIVARLFYPRGGWGRAVGYIRHRLQRLPDSPERIARGIWAGVFVSFTPLYGTHFLLAALVAKLLRGNILAGLLATFFGNPLTFVPIAASALKTGYFLQGRETFQFQMRELGGIFARAWMDLWHNFLALFSSADAEWSGLSVFARDIFVPFLIGGIVPGVIASTICYYVAVPFIRVYQKRRKKTLSERRKKRMTARAVSSDKSNSTG